MTSLTSTTHRQPRELPRAGRARARGGRVTSARLLAGCLALFAAACADPSGGDSDPTLSHTLPAAEWQNMPAGCEQLLEDSAGESIGVASTEGAEDLVALRNAQGDTCVDSRVAVGEQLQRMRATASANDLRSIFEGTDTKDPQPHPDANPDVAGADPTPHPDAPPPDYADPQPHPDADYADPQPHPDADPDEDCGCEVWVIIIIIIETEGEGEPEPPADPTTPPAPPTPAMAGES